MCLDSTKAFINLGFSKGYKIEECFIETTSENIQVGGCSEFSEHLTKDKLMKEKRGESIICNKQLY